MAKRSTDQLVCPWDAPSPVYKGVEEGERPALRGAPQGESYSHREEERGKEERGGRKGGRRPPPCPIRTRGRGGARPALAAPPLLH